MCCRKPASFFSLFSGFDVYFGNYHCNLSKWGGVSDLGPWLKTILQSIFLIYWYCYVIRSQQLWRKGSWKWDLSRVRHSYLYYYHKRPLFHVLAFSVKIWILQVHFTHLTCIWHIFLSILDRASIASLSLAFAWIGTVWEAENLLKMMNRRDFFVEWPPSEIKERVFYLSSFWLMPTKIFLIWNTLSNNTHIISIWRLLLLLMGPKSFLHNTHQSYQSG